MSCSKIILVILLALTGPFVYSQQPLTIYDSFDDNKYNWWTGESGGGSQYIKDGKMLIDIPEKGWLLNISPYVEFEKDFKMEATIRQTDGLQNNGIGLMWGKGKDDQNYFIVTADGNYYISGVKTENGKPKGVREWVKSSLIKPLGQANILRVEQKSKILTFYINNEKVFSIPAFPWSGTSIGFASYTKMKVEIDDLKFQQDNIFINLPKNLTKGFVKENLGPAINTSVDDLVPIITADGTHLYFGRENYEGNVGGIADGEDFYMSTLNGTTWSTAENMGSPINDKDVNNIISISTDKNTILYVTASEFMTRSRNGSGWGDPQKIGLSFVNTAKYFEGYLAADGKAILFAAKNNDNLFPSDNPDDRDLFVSVQDENGIWGQPQNLGPKINTPFKDVSPFLAADGRTLYFSTNGRPGYGDSDIFMSKRTDDDWSSWSEPVNLGPEINSPYFDAYYVLPASGEYAYMVSSQNSLGKSDIVRIKVAKEVKPDPVVLVRGKTLDAKTKQPIAANILIDNLTTSKEVGEATSDLTTGDYQIVLPYGINYGFHAAAPGHLSVNENLELIAVSTYLEIQKDLFLLPIIEGQTIQLNNVFFEQAKAVLKPESYPELDRLIAIMKQNTTMEIELGGYTDNIGREVSLIALSMDRAGIVKKYMVDHGIPSKRITGKGYGPANPVVKNDTEEHRRMNRRVEFKIVKR